ncbi:right-handed parallel beta-helix repeat-containing protein [Myxosarcina sp. GI1]|uniref:right-handed parallel beta-helix repeat-containing protein n=1 Tax=Myxosarcina sp. GI1 TaxID=1541065 RepID=UPI000568A77C|nr:right-handed parallel beta-helix repeat-containing protein [Myxosarcina sp. GI1]
MKRRFFLFWLASISLTTIASITKPSQSAYGQSPETTKTVIFYVATNGSDRWSGKRKAPNILKTDGPFATLHRARDAIRELKNQRGGILQQPVTVMVRRGTYYLAEPLTLTEEDSGTAEFPITYQAYPNEKPVISGGRLINNWKRRGRFWVAKLPTLETGKWYFRLLRVDNDWAIRARYPKFDPDNPSRSWLYVNPLPPIANNQGRFNSSVGSIHNPGDKLEWNISVAKAGKYRVWIRYANNMKVYGVENMDGRTALRVNGGKPVKLQNLPNTGSFSTFRWSFAATLWLKAGKQTLTWENLQGGGLSIDALCLTDDFNWNPAKAIDVDAAGEVLVSSKRADKNLIVVQAEAFDRSVGNKIATFSRSRLRHRLAIAPGQFPNWQDWEGAEVNVFLTGDYGNAILPITQVDRAARTLYGNFTSADYPPAAGNRFFIENVREALNNPGEWYLDTQKDELIYLPRSHDFPKNIDVVAPAMDRLIVLQGSNPETALVENIKFQGLSFSDTDYTIADNYFFPANAAVWLSAARQCEIENCSFTSLGGYGVRIEKSSHDNRIVHNQMSQLGQGGVVLLGDKDSQPVNNLIAANDIHDGGKVYKHVAGVYIVNSSNNRIAHNNIYRMPRYGISLKTIERDRYSRHNIIEFNAIVDTNLETSDTGAIESYTGDRKQLTGNIIRFNYIRNVVGMGTNRKGQILSPYYTWGIYLDAHTSGVKVYGNVIIGTVRGGIYINGGKKNLVENNIFINGGKNQLRVNFRDPGFATGNIIRRNLVVYKNPQATLWKSINKGFKAWQPVLMSECDYNLYWHTGSLNLAAPKQTNLTPEGNFEQWQTAGFDRHSLIADPLFVNAEAEDYRLKPNSPAFKLGFKRIPLERIGISGFNVSSKQ